MFGIGLPELIVIFAVALIVVGPEKLPELAKTLARQVLELKKAASTLKDSIQEEVGEQKWKEVLDHDELTRGSEQLPQNRLAHSGDFEPYGELPEEESEPQKDSTGGQIPPGQELPRESDSSSSAKEPGQESSGQ